MMTQPTKTGVQISNDQEGLMTISFSTIIQNFRRAICKVIPCPPQQRQQPDSQQGIDQGRAS